MLKQTCRFFLLLFTCYHSFGQTESPYVLLISFDGFRSDYVERFDLPNFKQFMATGVRAEGIIPSFPSKTLPNHYSIVTGLYPGHHGLVDNYFYDPGRKSHFNMRMKQAVTDPYYFAGTPLWKLCSDSGILSASYFWVGSEVKDRGLLPDYFFQYDQSVPIKQRMDQVITWLKLPEQERPRFISLYFSSPDNESHLYGPFAEETKRSVLQLDSLLGVFMKQVDETKLPVNVVIVSDHGMSELRHQEDTYVFLDELIKPQEGFVLVNGGTQAHLYVSDSMKCDSIFAHVKDGKGFYAVMRHNFPERWHYNHERSGDILLVAKPGFYLMTGSREKILSDKKPGALFGVHGYDALVVADMYGIFYAKGPALKSGIEIPAFENIHIYPLIAKILGLALPQIDGKKEVLEPLLR